MVRLPGCWPKFTCREEDHRSAVPVLEIALDTGEASDALKLSYVDAIFGGQNPLLADEVLISAERLQHAEALLEEMLEVQPQAFAVQLAMAEIMGVRGRNQESLKVFRGLIETAQVTLPEWRWRLFAGMGAVADSLEMNDIALAAMKEAAQAAPERLDVLKKLAKIYLHADLPEEAFQTVRSVRNMEPDQIDVLVWYADIASLTGNVDDALEALGCATEIEARSPDLWVRLAGIQSQIQDDAAVRKSLNELTALDEVPAQALRQAAHLYIGLGEMQEAVSCLEKTGEAADK